MENIHEIFFRIREYFPQTEVFGIGVLLIVGFFGGKLAQRFNLPTICGYIVAGILCGPSVLSVVHVDVVERLEPVPHIALGLIAITIGGHFSLRKVRQLGWGTLVITVAQLLATFLAVFLGLILIRLPVGVALILGAISAATAPAATVAVVTEYRARGNLVDTLLATVALDDAGCILLFSMAATLSGLLSGQSPSLTQGILEGFAHIGLSVTIGALLGWWLHLLVVNRQNTHEIIVLVLGFVFLSTSITMETGLSPLLATMVLGFVLVNAASKNERVFRMLEPIEMPIYGVFFALAGSELQLNALGTVGLVGVVFILMRFFGKYTGALLGGILTRAPGKIRKYLGFCLFPQAGVAIGLVVLALELPGLDPNVKNQMHTTVLASVLVSELIGPPLVRLALFRSGEAYASGGKS